ncbi:MAG: glycoside hydrolase family 172 protein, partial [Bacillota bacterium]
MMNRTTAVLMFVALGLSTFASAQDPLSGLYRPREGRSMRVTSTAKLPDGSPNPDSNADNFRVAPGKTHVIADLKGPGIIRHIWMTFLGPEPQPWAPKGAANHREMLLRIYWDGREQPDVEAPVGDFFAAGFGKRMEVRSLPVQVEGGAGYNCFWPMPFAKSARIEVVNDSDKEIALLYYNVDWQKMDSLPPDTLYFCAQYRQEYPVQKGRDYLVLDTEGRGHYVGTVLSIRSRSPEWFGEGDEKITLDDDKSPSIWGTGTEDYFLCAWGLRKCSFPYFGVPFTESWGALGGHTCAYRWHIADPIVFQKRIRVALEHYGWISVDENPQGKRDSWNEREDDYASVAFWYQLGPSKRFATVPPAAQRMLPELDIVVPGSTLTDAKHHGDGDAIVQTGELWTGNAQLLYQPPQAKNAWLEIPFEVKTKEPRRLVLKLTTSFDFGIYQASLNGVKLGRPINLYSAETDVAEFPLLDFWPDPGHYVLRLE